MTLTWNNEKRKLADLKPYEHNPRIMSVDAAKRLERSLRNTGYAEVIAIDTDNTIVAGHQRYHTLLKIHGLDFEVDVRVPCRKLTDKEFKDYLVASNKDVGEWDYDVLSSLFDVDELLEKGFEMPELGIEEVEEIEAQEDDIPDEPIEPKTVLGDLYELGEHRLLCGDSINVSNIELLTDGKKAELLLTDPPYGVSYTDKNEYLNSLGTGHRLTKAIENDSKSPTDMNIFWTDVFKNAYIALDEKSSYYVFSPQIGNLMMMMMMSLEQSGLQLKHMLIWVKNNHVLGRCDYNYKHEPVLYGWKQGGTHTFYGKGKCKTSVLEFNKPLKNDLHPTMKPIELLCELILNSSKQSSIVLDLFGGSGSTLIACEQTNRKCFMIELDTSYCDIIVQRYVNHMKKNEKPYTVKRNGEEIEWE